MAVLTELFLVLAGFDSEISQRDGVHPAELETFSQAREFGAKVLELRDLTSSLQHPICRILKQQIVVEYLESLAEIEARTVKKILNGSQEGATTNSLRFSATIIAQTVDVWSTKFEFGLACLKQLDLDFEESYIWLRDFVNVNAGYDDMRELGISCQMELDKHWLSELRLCILGESKEMNGHPALRELEIIEDVHSVTKELKAAAFQDIRVLNLVVELMEEVSEMLVPRKGLLNLPLDPTELQSVLEKIQHVVSRNVAAKLISTDEVSILIKVLRDVVLCGSSLFAQSLVDSANDFDEAYELYLNHEILSPESQYIARLLLTVRDKKLRIRFSHSEIRMLKLVMTKKHCTIFEAVFEWLEKIVRAQNRIKVGSGNVAFRYTLFFSALWYHYQISIDDAMNEIQIVMLQKSGANVRRVNDWVLRRMVSSMFLDSTEFRTMLKEVTSSDFGSIEPLKKIVRFLWSLSPSNLKEIGGLKAFGDLL